MLNGVAPHACFMIWSFIKFLHVFLPRFSSVLLYFYLKETATSLFIASQSGYVDVVRELISFRPSLNAPLQVSINIIFIII